MCIRDSDIAENVLIQGFFSTELLKLLSFRMDSILSYLTESRYNWFTNIDPKGKEEN